MCGCTEQHRGSACGSTNCHCHDDFVTIGPECFTDQAGNVVSYKGQEYVRTCGSFVSATADGGQAFCTLTYDHPDPSRHVNTHLTPDEAKTSPTVEHVRRELEMIGEDPDIIEWYCRTAAAFMSYGHSGGSFMATLPVLTTLLKRENLSALSDDPDEWYHHEAEMWDGKTGIWQNKRNSRMFSKDEGKTFFDVEHPDKGVKHTMPRERQAHRRGVAEHYG